MTGRLERPRVAFFCMEYGLSDSFPIYAGGLGILSGDFLKAARDNGYPVVGVGILWNSGYTDQFIGEHGWPYDRRVAYARDFLEDTHEWVELTIRGETVRCRIWKTNAFGNADLYLLDAADGSHDWITSQLYGGYDQDRVAQEMVLGIGGVRALRRLGIPVDVYHFNEGHAVFAGIELIRERMARGVPFEIAWEETRQEVVFTTHTPVQAGNETHDHGLLQHMGAYNTLGYGAMREIGGDPFNMTVAGLRLANLANGVSKLHGVTARGMWDDVQRKAPILALTNGVHVPTWQDERIAAVQDDSDALGRVHARLKEELLDEVARQTGERFRPDVLTIGFARRAAPYKRSDLIFRRPDVIEPLLESGRIQLIFAGKAHPRDDIGKRIVANLVAAARRFPKAVAFLENYSMRIGRLMTAGCDVWLNNPQRPLEASGTSGMKAALNGVLNLSVLDGWWPEACRHGQNGWQFASGYEGPAQQQRDLAALYDVLLGEVMPVYYEDPPRWRRMMVESIRSVRDRFSAARMVDEYFNLLYLPTFAIQPVHAEAAPSGGIPARA